MAGIEIGGNQKIMGARLGDSTLFERNNDTWLPCKVSSDFSGTPVFMSYDPDTKVTSFLGGITFTLFKDSIPQSVDVLELPKGYHFTGLDPKISNNSLTGGNTASVSEGKLSIYYKTFSYPGYTSYPMWISMGDLRGGDGFYPKVMTTTTVAPD